LSKTHHNNGEGVFTSGKKGASEPKKPSEHLQCQRKTEGGQEKRLANPGGGKIITKTAKNSSFTP
jgi:hypothetical protein